MATRLSTGLRNAMMGNNSYPICLRTGTTFAFEDGTGTDGRDRITDSGNGFVSAGYKAGMYVSVAGSTSNNIVGAKVLAVAVGYLEVAAATLTTEVAGDQVIIAAGANGGSLDEILRNGVIDIYSGAQPATADAVETGTKLLRITLASGAFTPGAAANGINLGTAAAGVVNKEAGEVWSGAGIANGTAGWFRHYANDVTTGSSSTAIRYDGVCGVGAGELRLSSLTIVQGATVTVDSGAITQPASA